MNVKKTAVVINGFIHDFAAGYWAAAIFVISTLHRMHLRSPCDDLNLLERNFFWQSVVAMAIVFATGAGRTFTYVDNYYGSDAEVVRRRMLIIKHVLLLGVFALGYLFIWRKVFH